MIRHDTAKPQQQDWLALAREVIAIEIEGLEAVSRGFDDAFVTALQLLAGCRGRVALMGLGKSGLVARKIAATLSSTGTPAFFLHPVEGAHGDLGMVRAEDVILAVSNSGETDELNALLPSLRSLGPAVIALTGEASSTLGALADVTVVCRVPREACPLDLAPTASTTAALATGDALAVCLMRWKAFDEQDFRRVHPGGALGQRLKTRVRECMHTHGIPVVTQDQPLREALDVLDAGRLGAVLLTDSAGALSGILTDGDLRRLVCRGAWDLDAPVTAAMTANPATAQPDQSVAELLDIMESRAITVLPVVDADGRLLGVVHLHDLLGKGSLRFAG